MIAVAADGGLEGSAAAIAFPPNRLRMDESSDNTPKTTNAAVRQPCLCLMIPSDESQFSILPHYLQFLRPTLEFKGPEHGAVGVRWNDC